MTISTRSSAIFRFCKFWQFCKLAFSSPYISIPQLLQPHHNPNPTEANQSDKVCNIEVATKNTIAENLDLSMKTKVTSNVPNQ